MKNQDPLWNACRANQSSFSGERISGISLGDEGVLYTEANDLPAFERERSETLCQTIRLAQKRLLEERKRFLNNGIIAAACWAY